MNLPQEASLRENVITRPLYRKNLARIDLHPRQIAPHLETGTSARRIIAVDGKVELPGRIVAAGIFGAHRHLNLVAVAFADVFTVRPAIATRRKAPD